MDVEAEVRKLQEAMAEVAKLREGMAIGMAEVAKLREDVAKLEEGRMASMSQSSGTSSDLLEKDSSGQQRQANLRKFALMIFMAFCVITVTYLAVSTRTADAVRPHGATPNNVKDLSVDAELIQSATISGMHQSFRVRAKSCVRVAFFAAVSSTVGSSFVVTFMPQHLPSDFNEKGTLSNVSQHVETAWGRLFTVALFTAALLLLASDYTMLLYPPWSTNLDAKANPIHNTYFAPLSERRWRELWVVIPSVGFMVTAVIPSLSTSNNLSLMLTLVHNIVAPFSIAFMVIMETVQLTYGEHAFAYFFHGDITIPLQRCGDAVISAEVQRLRVVLCIYAWLAAAVFLGIQVYLGVRSVLGLQVPTSYTLASVSYYSEVFGMCLAFALPVTASFQGIPCHGPMEWARMVRH